MSNSLKINKNLDFFNQVDVNKAKVSKKAGPLLKRLSKTSDQTSEVSWGKSF